MPWTEEIVHTPGGRKLRPGLRNGKLDCGAGDLKAGGRGIEREVPQITRKFSHVVGHVKMGGLHSKINVESLENFKQWSHVIKSGCVCYIKAVGEGR